MINKKDYKAQRLYLKLHRAKNKEQRFKAESEIREYFNNKQDNDNE